MLLIVGSFIILLATGLPIAFCFMVLNLLGVYFFWGGVGGLEQYSLSVYASLATFKYSEFPLNLAVRANIAAASIL